MGDKGKGRRKPKQSASGKHPATVVAATGGKRPAVAAIGDGTERRPVWRFGLIDSEGPFPWSWEAIETHLRTLIEMERKPWEASIHTGTIGAKRIPLSDPKYEKAATRRLEDLNLDDADALWELRVGGAPRFWGIRDGTCFHFLWWDPRHLVYPTKRARDN